MAQKDSTYRRSCYCKLDAGQPTMGADEELVVNPPPLGKGKRLKSMKPPVLDTEIELRLLAPRHPINGSCISHCTLPELKLSCEVEEE